MKKRFLILIFIFCLPFIIYNTGLNTKADDSNQLQVIEEINFELKSKSAILIEPITKSIIFEKDSKTKLAPASMTKIMTLILVCDSLKNNDIKINDEFITSKYAASMGGSQIYLKENEKMSVDDLIKSVAIASANDAAVVLAEGVCGSVNEFVRRMNEKAVELGCINSNFVNPNGLPEDNHYSCAYDMAIISSYLINNYGDFILKYTSMYESYIREDLENKFWLVNTNKLIRIDGIDGLKTGMTDEAGYCLTCTMNKNNIRMISVVMGAETIDDRKDDTLALLNYGVNNYSLEKIYNKGDIIKTINNIVYSPKEFNVIVSNDVYLLKKKSEKYDISIEENIIYNINDEILDAGSIKVYCNGILINEVGLKLEEKINKASIFTLLIEVIKEIFFGY